MKSESPSIAEIVDDHDVGMGERGHPTGLALEALSELLIARQGVREDLDGHLAFEAAVEGEPDRGHTTRADASLKLIAIDE